MKNNGIKELLKRIRTGVRLKSKAPQVIRDKSKYTRKDKHKKKQAAE